MTEIRHILGHIPLKDCQQKTFVVLKCTSFKGTSIADMCGRSLFLPVRQPYARSRSNSFRIPLKDCQQKNFCSARMYLFQRYQHRRHVWKEFILTSATNICPISVKCVSYTSERLPAKKLFQQVYIFQRYRHRRSYISLISWNAFIRTIRMLKNYVRLYFKK